MDKKQMEEYLNKLYLVNRKGNDNLIRMFLNEGTLKSFLISNGYPKSAYVTDPNNLDLEVNYSEKMTMLNEYYEDTHNSDMLKQLNDAMCSLLEGDQREIFVCLNLIATQLKKEENKKNSFSLDNIRLLKKIEKTLIERKNELSQAEVISIRNNYDGTIENYGKIVSSRLTR